MLGLAFWRHELRNQADHRVYHRIYNLAIPAGPLHTLLAYQINLFYDYYFLCFFTTEIKKLLVLLNHAPSLLQLI